MQFERPSGEDKKPFDAFNPVENERDTQQGRGEAQSNGQGKDPLNVDAKGNVDIREVAGMFVNEEPENASTFQQPPASQPEPKQSTPSAATQGSEPTDDEEKKVDMHASEFIDGELAFETIDFFLVAGLCVLARTDDENQFNLAAGRRKKLIYVWDKYLKSIDYKIPVHYALILLYVASYGPLGWKAFKDGKKAKNTAAGTDAAHSMPGQPGPPPPPFASAATDGPIPQAPHIVMPKKPKGGARSKFEKQLINNVEALTDHNKELMEALNRELKRNNPAAAEAQPPTMEVVEMTEEEAGAPAQEETADAQ